MGGGRSLYSRLFLFLPHSQIDAPPNCLLGSSPLRSTCWSAGTKSDLEVPTQGEGLQANTTDTVLLDWTSTLPSTVLRMWCKNGTDGDNLALGSSIFLLRLKVRVELTCLFAQPAPSMLTLLDPSNMSWKLMNLTKRRFPCFYIFNAYKKRGAKARTTGVFEKDGVYGVYEEEGHVHEVQGSAAWKKTKSRAESWVGGEEDYTMRYSPVELPAGSSNFP